MPLSRLIDVVNERFGTDFTQADQLLFDQIVETAIADEGLREAAAVNPDDKFKLVFRNLLEQLFADRMDPERRDIHSVHERFSVSGRGHGLDGFRSLPKVAGGPSRLSRRTWHAPCRPPIPDRSADGGGTPCRLRAARSA